MPPKTGAAGDNLSVGRRHPVTEEPIPRPAPVSNGYNRTVPNRVPWVCPKCFAVLCGPEVLQIDAQAIWRTHGCSQLAESSARHNDPDIDRVTEPVLVPESAPRKVQRLLRPCPRCGASLRHDRIVRHITKIHGLTGKNLAVVLESLGLNIPALQFAPPSPTKEIAPTRKTERTPTFVAPKPLLRCSECGVHVPEDAMARHFQKFHQPDAQPISPRVPTGRFPFALLPPGEWDIQDVKEHYRKQSRNFPIGLGGRQIDWSRLEEIETLRPVRCHVGKESWLGYVVFEFLSSDRVVLECPIEGNATYILSGDWEAMVGHTKAELRREYGMRSTKVVHKGDWLDRIREALRKGTITARSRIKKIQVRERRER